MYETFLQPSKLISFKDLRPLEFFYMEITPTSSILVLLKSNTFSPRVRFEFNTFTIPSEVMSEPERFRQSIFFINLFPRASRKLSFISPGLLRSWMIWAMSKCGERLVESQREHSASVVRLSPLKIKRNLWTYYFFKILRRNQNNLFLKFPFL